jgi:MarR family transcriptional regulator, organic hydroperoxide resistance regulator
LGASILPIEDCISFLLAKAGQQVSRRFRDTLAKYDVTPVQYAVLSVLWERQALSSADLSSRLAIDSATMTGLVDRMEALGLLLRRSDPEDRRVSRVYLTARGQGLRKALIKAVVDLNRKIAGELGSQAAGFQASLRRLADAASDEAA